MIEALTGGRTAEKVLLYLSTYGEGYSQGIAKTFGVPFSMVYKQLIRMESKGLLVSQVKGKTRLFRWNPRFPLLKELQILLQRALDLLPESEREMYFRERRRPRRTGKPL